MTYKQVIKRAAHSVLPEKLFERIQSIRSRNYQLKFLTRLGLLDQMQHYIEEHGTVIQAGPFAGMIYPLGSATSRWAAPMLLGTYELDLHPTLHKIAGRTYECVIDIGSAEGYYAVGLARMMQIPVLAYDPEPRERAWVSQMAKRNGVDHLVTLEGLFTTDDMQRFAGRNVLVVCDCEGFEEVLFRPDTLPLTRTWDILIELHGTADKVLPALPWEHKVSIVDYHLRTGLQDEYRSATQRWLWCESPVSAAA